MAPVDARRVAPPLVAAVVVGFLTLSLLRHRDAEPLPDPEAADATRVVDPYAASGEDKRITGESSPAPGSLPRPRAPLPEGHPPVPGVPESRPEAPAAAPAPAAAAAALPFTYRAPASWTAEAPTSSMRAAQWSLPAEPGGAAGQMVVFRGIGGSVAQNVERWEKEFGGAKAKTSVATSGEVTVTRVDVEGTFSGGMGPRDAGPREAWRLLGAVVETPQGTFFVKGTGPAAVMAREEAAFDAFLASIRAGP
jgi:hypothetical protein